MLRTDLDGLALLERLLRDGCCRVGCGHGLVDRLRGGKERPHKLQLLAVNEKQFSMKQ